VPEVSWPLSPGESGAAALELALEELGFVVEAELPAVDESVPVAEVVPVGVPLEEVMVALVLPGPVGEEVAIPVEVVEEDDGVDVEDTVAAAAFFCANPGAMLVKDCGICISNDLLLTKSIFICIENTVHILQKCISQQPVLRCYGLTINITGTYSVGHRRDPVLRIDIICGRSKCES